MQECLSEYHVINIKLKSEHESFFSFKGYVNFFAQMGKIVSVHMSWYSIHVKFIKSL